jgi:beta-alanine--pyruvate transaminase
MRHTLDIERNGFSKGLPQHGIELADDLERLVALHGAETIAAVIGEPMYGSAGVILPPKGYLDRLRTIADKHGILLIFDEVIITGFGRLGTPFATDHFGVVPDLVITAKGLTNGAIPMGAVFASRKVYDALMVGPENQIELFHGYTYWSPSRQCRWHRHFGNPRGRRPAHPRRIPGRHMAGCSPLPEGAAARRRHPQPWSRRRR